MNKFCLYIWGFHVFFYLGLYFNFISTEESYFNVTHS